MPIATWCLSDGSTTKKKPDGCKFVSCDKQLLNCHDKFNDGRGFMFGRSVLKYDLCPVAISLLVGFKPLYNTFVNQQ